ncbi:hypothetical protein [Sinomonas susongensis]|uniref:hypothetical protein n=1 Tax=Sinomonas susongensis TaxID=1324851 RepID=UPI001108D7DA|nr:hypothetical protein [Sinomonas susongensis]
MENLLPPLLILLCVVAIVILMLRRGARRSKHSADGVLPGGPEAAAAASSKLNEEQHRVVYSFIAQGLTVQAIAAYRQATGTRLVEARNAVLLMDRYPQAFGGRAGRVGEQVLPKEDLPKEGLPRDEAAQPGSSLHAGPVGDSADEHAVPGTADEAAGRSEPDAAVPAPAAPHPREEAPPSSSQKPKVPTTLGERSTTRYPYRYRAIVSNGQQTLEVASNLLNDEIYAEIKALAQIGDAEDAARMLWRHSDISIEEARAFVELL